MIVSFYDKNFRGLQNNASLVVDKESYKLIKRPIEMNELRCKCEPFTEDIQPTFMIIKDDIGRYVYGSLAGIPVLNKDNQTEITATDLKSMLSSDILVDFNVEYNNVNGYIDYIFDAWKIQVNQNSFNVELKYKEYDGVALNVPIGLYVPAQEQKVYNAFTEIQKLLRYYNLYIESTIDLVNKKVVYTIGQMMLDTKNIKLWEYGIRDYGKYIASVNETKGYYKIGDTLFPSDTTWILTSNNNITTNEANRDIYPIKKKIIIADSKEKADSDALTKLLDALYNEDININTTEGDFESKFAIYLKRGQGLYKNLPCGEIEYDSVGIKRIKIGFRYSNVSLI